MTTAAQHRFLATVPRGLSDLLLRELTSLGATQLRERPTGVSFQGSLETGYRACLWSRVASRVLLQLHEFNAASAEEVYSQLYAFDWSLHVDPARSIACDFSGNHPAITNSHFGALRLKDAICDRLRRDTGSRPDVALVRPAVRLHAHANGAQIALSLDMAGEGLHRRGYRTEAGEAPLRENLAAGILLRTRWPEAAASGAAFLDPMCGSGTFVIEAALIAADRAPGLTREYHGFVGWRGHDETLWRQLLEEARQRALDAVPGLLRGCDVDQRALTVAVANAGRAGVAGMVVFEHRPVATVAPRAAETGLICVNPPYGERLGDAQAAQAVYAELGLALRERFAGWDAAILCASPETAGALRLRSYRSHELMNGALPVRLVRVDLNAPGSTDRIAQAEQQSGQPLSAGGRMLANRLQKNLQKLSKEARRAQVSCYRLYDADMPEYAFAIDRYVEADSALIHLYVQEYAAPATIEIEAARRRRREAFAALPGALEVPPERIHVRLRKRQSGRQQYERQAQGAEGEVAPRTLVVEEGGLKFAVNLDEYLDTGLFLDHRLTRGRLRTQAAGGRFLNLFCYTASATVYAAAGGAASSLSLDLSNSYLDWAAQNFRLNAMSRAHRLERADCLEWLRNARAADEVFDLIFLDPPTFSNSKRMQGVLDVQRDHPELIEQCMRLLSAPGGRLVFSTNAQRFRLDPLVSERWQVNDVSSATLPFDFARHPRIHRCYEITLRPDVA
jgi:23S rRNA (guanine2445-N2)-methyltransferase / 23S rRNA (guanine2069-N7)-methyltransferase